MNAKTYKIIFSKTLGNFVAVGENAKNQGKARGRGLGGGSQCGAHKASGFVGALLMSVGLTHMAWAQDLPSNALPSGGVVSAGAAVISSAGAAMTIDQSSARAAINWQSFDVGANASVQVNQPSSSAVLLNRIGSQSPSQILGRVSANGQLVLVNPNGVSFGKDGAVSAASVTASTLGISDADFMSGEMRFTRDGATGEIVNHGSIKTTGGYVALLGARVSNEGQIESHGGDVYMGAGESVQLPVSSTGRIKLDLSAADVNAAVSNSGAVLTEGGQVYLQAAAANDALASVMHSGRVDTSAEQAGNVVVLADGGNIQVSGRIRADSLDSGQPSAEVIIGRDLDTGALAKTTDVRSAQLSARGGLIETSGEQIVTAGVTIEAAKEWLLDPNDIVIDNSTTSGTNIANAQTLNGTSYINATDLGRALQAANVTIATSATATGGNGYITVNNDVLWTSSSQLSLNAHGDVNVNARIGEGVGRLQVTAGQDIRFNAGAALGQSGGLGSSTNLNAARDVYIGSSVSIDAYFTLVAGGDAHLNANVANGGLGANISAGRDVFVNAAQNNTGSYTITSGRDLYVNADITSGVDVNLYGGGQSWSSSAITGALRFDPTAKVTYGRHVALLSGRTSSMGGIDDASTSNTRRTDFSDVNLVWHADDASVHNAVIQGFNQVTLANANGSGAAMNAGLLQVDARDITLNADLVASSANLYAGIFNSDGGYSISYNQGPVTGWNYNYGRVNIASGKRISYANDLRMQSGKELSTNARSSLSSGAVQWKDNNGVGEVLLDGFDTVSIDAALSASKVGMTARQIDVSNNSPITGAVGVRLWAGAFDALGSSNNMIGGYNDVNITSNGGVSRGTSNGWISGLEGTVNLGGSTVYSTQFDIRSGTVAGDRTQRLDVVAAHLQPYTASGATAPSDVKRLYLAGYRDVVLNPGFTSVASAGEYTVYARNINASAMAEKTLNAYSLNLIAGAFQDVASVNKYVSSPDNTGVLTLPDTLGIQSSVARLESGLNGTARTDFKPAGFSPYVDPADPTRYTGDFSTNGLSSGLRAGGARGLYVSGFTNIELPDAAYPLNVENVRLVGSNITINGDMNTGQADGNALVVLAGAYSSSTGKSVAEGTGFGKVVFNNNPVLRTQGYVLTASLDNSTKSYGGGSQIKIVNGTDDADFTALLGYSQPDYSAGGDGVINLLTLKNFNDTLVQLEAQAGVASPVLNLLNNESSGGAIISSKAASASGEVDNIHIHNDVRAQGGVTLDAAGGIRMGDHVVKATNLSVAAGLDAAVNSDVVNLNLTSRGEGKTVVVNEANNVNLNAGASSDVGSIELNARGEITLTNNLSRSGATSGVTLRADAEYGRTIAEDDATQTLVVNDLNATFAAYDVGTFGELGGDGLGTISVSTAQPTVLVPYFRRVAVVDGASFTVPANNTYFKADGTAYAAGTVLNQGSFVMVSGAIPAGLDTVTKEGSPYRLKALVGVNGWEVPADHQFFDAAGDAIAKGVRVQSGEYVYYRSTTSLTAGSISAAGNNGTTPLYVVGGYSATTSASSVPVYTSMGFNFGATYSPLAFISQPASTTQLAVDTAVVDTSLAGHYYGNPLSATNNALNLSGQFYTFEGDNSAVGYVQQGAPTSVNGYAVGNSASGNGWDLSWKTATISTNGGDLRLFSGPKHALAGAGYEAGDWSDFSLYSNPTYNDLTKDKLVYEGAANVSSGTGDLVVLGFRDVLIKDPGNLSSSGNVTIGAARDMVFSADANFNSNAADPKLVTLVAGGVLTSRQANGSYATIGATTGVGTSNLMIVAGGGVDVQVNAAAVAGSLQDNPNMSAAPMAGGLSPSGAFTLSSVNAAGLVVGGPFTNDLVNDISFDGTKGILYAADTPLSRTGISSVATADQLSQGSVDAGYGAVSLTSAYADITVNQAINTSSTGGTINLSAPRDVVQAADILAGAGDVTLSANAGAISRTAGTVGGNDVELTAATAIGSSAQAIQTSADTLKMTSADGQYITEADDVRVAASTSANGNISLQTTAGSITVGTVGGLSGLSANGAGHILLNAGGSGSDLITTQAIATGSAGGDINLKAADGVQLGASVTTSGNAFIEASAGNVGFSTTVTANDLVLTAGGAVNVGIGAVPTQVNRMGITAGDSVDVSYAGDLTLSAVSRGGALSVTTDGDLTVASLEVQPQVLGNASGYTGSGLAAKTLLTLKATTGSIAQADGNQLLSAADAIFDAATTIGSSSQAMLTDLGNLFMLSAGDQYVTEANDITVGGATRSNGSLNLQTIDGSITVADNYKAIYFGYTANGSGHISMTANGEGSDIAFVGALSSGTGEINLKAADSVLLGGVSTEGNAFIEAVAGDITNNEGNGSVWADQAVLTAAQGSVGAVGQALQTHVQLLGISTAANAFVSEVDGMSVSAQSTGEGVMGLATTSGTLTATTLAIAPSLSGNAAGYAALDNGASIAAAGAVRLSADNAGAAQGVVISDAVTASGDLLVNATSSGATAIAVNAGLSSGGNMRLEGITANGANAIALGADVVLTNTSNAGLTRLQANQGDIAASAGARIAQGAAAGAVEIVAGTAGTDAGKINGAALSIMQNSNAGVLMQTSGLGQLSVAGITNVGTGDVVLSAGSAIAAGNGAGGQVVAGNGVAQISSGNTLIYSGNVTETSAISDLVSGFSGALRLTDVGADKQNTQSNAAYGDSIAGTTEAVQVYFRERVNLDTALATSVTYGDALGGSDIRAALVASHGGTVITKTANAGQLQADGGIIAAALDPEALGNSASFAGNYSTSSHLKASDSAYTLDASLRDFTGVSATLLVNKKSARIDATAGSVEYNGVVQQQAPAVSSGFIAGDDLTISGTASGKNAGTYTSAIALSGSDVDNYTVSISDADWVITANTTAAVTLTANSGSATYNGATQFVSGLTSATGLLGDDTVDNIGVTANTEGKNAGSYDQTVFGSLTELQRNYQNVTLTNGLLEITKKDVSLTSIAADHKTYDGTNAAVISAGALQGVIAGESLSVSGVGTFSDKNVGAAKTVQVEVGTLNLVNGTGDWSNYNLVTTGALTTSADISAKALGVSLKGPISKTYDASTAATLQSSDFLLTGFVEGEGANILQTAGVYASKNVVDNQGQGQVSAQLEASDFQAIDATDLRNYVLPAEASGAVGMISPAALTIRVADSNAFVTQDANLAVNNGYSYDGLKGSDRAETALQRVPVASDRSYSGTQFPIVGSYSGVYGLSFTPQATAGNYTVSVAPGALTVVPADQLLINIAAAQEVYGNRTSTDAAKASGVSAQYCLDASDCNGSNLYTLEMVSGDQINWTGADNTGTNISFTTTLDVSNHVSSGGFVNAGDYRWGVSDVSTSTAGQFKDYRVNSGLLNIARLTVNPTADQLTKVYDGSTAAANATLTVSELQPGDRLVATASQGSYTTKNVIANDTVTFNLVALSGDDASNYTLASSSLQASGDITPKALKVTGITAESKVYDGNTLAVMNTSQAVFDGLIQGDVVGLSGVSGSFADQHVGKGKVVSVSSAYVGGDVRNYTIESQATTRADITPKALTASLQGVVSKTYDATTVATLKSSHFLLSGFIDGEGGSVSQTNGVYASKNVDANGGSGVVSATLTSEQFQASASTRLSNYVLPTSASGAVGEITPAALTVKVGDARAFVTQDANTAAHTGFDYIGLQGGESASTALVALPMADQRTYSGVTYPLVGTYQGVYGLSASPIAQHGNYTVTVQAGALEVVAADELLITIPSATETYGVRTAANAGSATGVTAQYCLDATSCNGDNLRTLTMSQASANHWQWTATDSTDNSMSFDTTLDLTGHLSSGGYVNVGDYVWGVANLVSDKAQPFGDIRVNSGTLTITPLAVGASAVSATKVYDGTDTATGVALQLADTLAGDVVSAAAATGHYSSRNVINDGVVTYTDLSLAGPDSSNYSFVKDSVQTTGSITPKALHMSGITASDKVYDGGEAATVDVSAAVYDGLVAGDEVLLSATGTFADKNVGEDKTVTLTSAYSGADLGNYTVTSQAVTTASITPKALTVVGITAADKVYDAGTLATVDVSSAVLQGLVAGDALLLNATGAFEDKRAGTGKRVNLISTYSGADAGNYTITSQLTTSADISRKQLTVSGIAALDKVYDGGRSASLDMSGLQMDGLMVGDDLNLAVTAAFDDKNAGVNKAVALNNTYTGADLSNYTIVGQLLARANVNKAQAEVTANSASLAYNGTEQVVTGFTARGLVAGETVDNLTGVSALGAGKNAGIYVTQASGDDDNYALTFVNGALTITPREEALTLTARGRKLVYNGTEQSVSGFVVEGLVGLDTASNIGVSSGAYGRNAGTYTTVYRGLEQLQTNYANVTLNTASLVIQPRSITVTATPTTVSFNGEMQTQLPPTVTASPQTSANAGAAPVSEPGFVAGDDVRLVGLAAGVAPGRYVSDLGVEGADANNYAVTYINDDLLINPNDGGFIYRPGLALHREMVTRITYSGFGVAPHATGLIDGKPITVVATPDLCTSDNTAACACEDLNGLDPKLDVSVCSRPL